MLDLCIDHKIFDSPKGARKEILRHVEFSIRPGEVVGLLGPSGIGKSTMLRIVLGLDDTYQGYVRHAPGRIGVMFQEPRLLPWMTVAENLRVVVTSDMPSPDIMGLLDAVHLAHAANLYPRQLSLGMARRVTLARALAVSPTLLVLDEPFASLDPQLSAALAEIISSWAKNTGGAVLLATHELKQALVIASRVLVLFGTPPTLACDMTVAIDERDMVQKKLNAEFSFLQAGDYQTSSTD